ncbi:aminotransferase class I/II-fold pyridoxal phosphate-dependent enzyme [Sphingomonas sp. DT-204]|uniref:aminotransferase class I/II-fold pyridoxal phosphate-dependent enzyme n=1 Tax=Sphingomonas sp. DT-204 TaxID=3396166 RepID=UPI003F1CB085
MTIARRLRYPLIAPRPPRPSQLGDVFARIEATGTYSNHGPEVRRFEAAITERMFAGRGASLALANATLGLMLAIRDAADRAGRPGGYALMPAFTFAATAEAAMWAGLTPLLCDVDPADWAAAANAEEALLAEYGERIAVVVPYATFGNAIDLTRYRRYARRHGVGVVIDAAASLGTLDDAGTGFGAGYPHAVVFSMQATKPFAVAEGAVVHSGDTALIERLRAMANFGFEAPRSASLPGLNAKLPEVLAAIASAKLDEIEEISERRALLEASYREALDGLGFQRVSGRRRALGFMPVLLPPALSPRRAAIVEALAARGIGAAHYFSPHLGQQPLFRQHARLTDTPVADDIAARVLSLPATDDMTPADVRTIAAAVRVACGLRRTSEPRAPVAETLIAGGGPSGTAILIAAAKAGRLGDLGTGGLTIVERGSHLGSGRLARYAIASDSTAQTFLTALEAQPDLAGHPAVRTIEEWRDKLGVPLAATGPFLDVIGERLGLAVERGGGQVLTGHEVLGARRAGGLWHVAMRRREDGHRFEAAARNLVIATGGHQPLDRLAGQQIAGEPLVRRAGDRLLQSDEVLALGGLDKVADLLAGKRNPRVAVIGGSTSALTTVALLLRSRPGIPFGAGGITLLHRRPLRPFYPSVEAAHAEGFTDFGPDDICPLSGFVYRLAGFRLEARELVLRILGVDGRVPDPRVAVHRVADEDPQALTILDRADIVIAALGYRPRALPLQDAAGAPITLAADQGEAMVDDRCRVLGADGAPLPDLYGIGLAAGFVPSGALGGEKSFRGQANGLWLWQNDVGRMIVEAILANRVQAAA